MNKRFDNPHFYNHVFYPTQLWRVFAPFIFGVALALGAIFFWNYINPHEALSWQIRTVAAVLALALMIPLFIFRLRQLTKMQVGVGPAGLYLRGYGLLTWSEIKKLEMWQHKRHGTSIKITTYVPVHNGSGQLAEQKKTSQRSLFEAVGESLDEMFIVGSEYISIPLEELFSLLQEYHQEYQQDDAQSGRHAPHKNHAEKNGFSHASEWSIRILVSVLFFCALIAVVLLKGGLEGLWITFGVGAFAATLLFFRSLHVLFEVIVLLVAIVLISLGIGSFIYGLIVDHALVMKALVGAMLGVFLCAIVIVLRHRKPIGARGVVYVDKKTE